MSEEKQKYRALRPSHAASITHGLCMTLNDLVHEEGARMSRRVFLQICGVADAAEYFAREASAWYGTRMGKDHDLLDELQDRYVEEDDG